MPESGKNGKRIEKVRKGEKKPGRVEPLRRSSKQSLKKSEEVLWSVFDTSLVGVAVCSPDKRWLYINDRICEIFGYSREELHRMTWDKLTHPDDLEADVAQFNQLLAGDIDKYEMEKRFIRKDGSVIYAKIYVSCRRDDKGKVEYDIGMLEDITERKRVEGALHAAEERFSEAFRASPDAMSISRMADGVIFEVNDMWEKTFGYNRAESVGKSSLALGVLSPAIRRKAIQQLRETGSLHNFETDIRCKTGEVRQVSLSGECLEIGGEQCLLTIAHDITEQKKVEEAIRTGETRFRELFNHMSSGVAVYEAVDGSSDFVFKDFNKAAEKIDKVNKSDVVGKRVTEVFPGVCEFGLLEVLRRVWKTRKAEWYPTTFYKDGRISGWRENYVYKLPCGEIVAVYDDIGERKQAEQALRESEERFRGLFEQSADAIVVFDTQQNMMEFNDKACEMYGYTREEFQELRLSDFEVIETEDDILAHAEKIIKKGSDTFETKHKTKDGAIIDVIVSAKAITIGSEKFIQSVWRDITQIKKSEEKLQQERNLLRTLIDQIPDHVYVKDKDGRFVTCNKTMIERWEFKNETDLIGKTDFDLFEHTKAQEYFEREQEVIKAGKPVINKQGKYTDRKGIVHYDLTTKVPLSDGHGNVTGLVGISRDITERILAEETLQNERNLLRTLIDHIPGLVYVKDKDSRFLAFNKAVTEYWDLEDGSHLIGKTDFDLFGKDEAQQYFDAEQEIIRTGRPIVDLEMYCTNRKGETKYLLVTKTPLLDSRGNIMGLLGIHQDISRRKMVEDKLLENQKQLKRLASQLALVEERERYRIAGELHDQIGQELTMAKIKLDALRSSSTSRPAGEVLAEVSEMLRRLIGETRSLTFDLSYPILYEIGFEAAVSEWLNEQVHDKNEIAVEFADDGRPKEMTEDMRLLLFRSVRELLINCIKHSSADKVKVDIRRIDDSIEITVEDNGVGFDPVEARAMITHKAGFGLFSIRESLEGLGGRIELESKPGAGCKAIMTAPLKGRKRKSTTSG